jgi:hypothetical protein
MGSYNGNTIARLLPALVIFLTCPPAPAQTPLRQQPVTKSDTTFCATYSGTLDTASLEACAQEAMGENDDIALKWASKAAENGSALAAFWAGTISDSTFKGRVPDYVQAYKWYEIAAALKGAEIAKLPPTSSSGSREDNRMEINYREATAKKLSPQQLVTAQEQSRVWLSMHTSLTR